MTRIWQYKDRKFEFPIEASDVPQRPLLMGIINVTPDSFSDGGRYIAIDHAVAHGLDLIHQGADLLDIGGESTRPGSIFVPADEEIRRILPVIQELRRHTDIPLSIDTYKAVVAKVALDAGADIINDISALTLDPEMAPIASTSKAGIVLMHREGPLRPMRFDHPKHPHGIVHAVIHYLKERQLFTRSSGIHDFQIALDPGIGFGKRRDENYTLIAHLDQLTENERPILVGASRKAFLKPQTAHSKETADHRIFSTASIVTAAILAGASILRVHDIAAMHQVVKVASELLFHKKHHVLSMHNPA